MLRVIFKILLILLLFFLVGCDEKNSGKQALLNTQSVSSQVKNDEAEKSNAATMADTGVNGENKFVVLSAALKGEGQGDIAKLVPFVMQGIKTAALQGSSIAAQNLNKDGALKINSDRELSLIFFLKPDSLIKFSEDPLYVKGSRDAGFLWSCVQSKLKDGISSGNFTQEQKTHLNELVKGFDITFFNTQGREITIVMPGNDPIVTLDGQEVIESDEMHEKVAEFFKATF